MLCDDQSKIRFKQLNLELNNLNHENSLFWLHMYMYNFPQSASLILLHKVYQIIKLSLSKNYSKIDSLLN